MIERASLRRERSLGDVIADSFSRFFANAGCYLVVASPGIVTAAAFAGVTSVYADSLTAMALIGLVRLLADFIIHQIVSTALIVALVDSEQGPPSSMRAFKAALGRLSEALAAIRAAIIMGLLAVTIIGIPLAVNRYVKWSFIAQAVMIDGQTSKTALSYSAEQVKGRWWPTFWRLLVMGIIVGIPTSGAAAAISANFPQDLASVVQAAIQSLTLPVAAISSTLIYLDLKARKPEPEAVRPRSPWAMENLEPPLEGSGPGKALLLTMTALVVLAGIVLFFRPA